MRQKFIVYSGENNCFSLIEKEPQNIECISYVIVYEYIYYNNELYIYRAIFADSLAGGGGG